MTLTNKQIKLINSLHSKKGRSENHLFLVEGEKGILELIKSSFKIQFIVLNETQSNHKIAQTHSNQCFFISDLELNKYSTLVTNNFGLAVVEMPQILDFENPVGITVVLDGIRDPGNLGTIIRICDWYGISTIILSNDCTDFYNPKVISASMGSFLRINHLYVDLGKWLNQYPNITKIGALLNGQSLHTYSFPETGFLVFGNESNGISKNVEELIDDHVTIPSFGGAESLNVGISCAVFLDNLKR
jgi:TrmH family RNA methyltransferase